MKFLTNNLYPRRRKPWTKLENQRLRLLYPKYSNLRLAREFGRTTTAIANRASALGLRKDVSKGYQLPLSDRRNWTGKETVFLLKHYKTMTFSDIAAAMERSCNSVAAKALRLGLKKNKLWTTEENKRLRQFYHKYSLKELAKEFNCSRYGLFIHAKKIRLPRKASPLSKYMWSREEIKYLTKNYHLMPSRHLAKHLKHPVLAIRHKASELGLRSGVFWTEKQKQYLKRWFHKKSFKELAESLGRNPSAVHEYALSLGLYRKHWTRHEIDKLTRLYGKDLTVVEIARCLGRGYSSVHYMLRVTGLKQKRPYR